MSQGFFGARWKMMKNGSKNERSPLQGGLLFAVYLPAKIPGTPGKIPGRRKDIRMKSYTGQ